MNQEKQDLKQIKKLEKQIENFQKQLSLQVKQKQIIKNYQMIEGDYQILISIYQANQLMPRGTNFFLFKTEKTACDAFVQIEIKDQIQKTNIKKDTNNPIFDQKFYFQFKSMTLEQLDKATITFRLYDKKRFILRDSLIGCFELDWTNVYFKRNHQIYRGWLTLMDPFDQQEGVMGYLLVSIAVLGQNDKVTVHDSAFIKDPLTTIEDTITMPKLQLIDYGINIQLYRAENLVPLDEYAGNVDAYVVAKFSGNKVDSSVKSSCNPQWDQLIRIGTGIPTKSKYVILEVRNRNYIFGDDIIGVIKIPFVDLKQESEPRWGHLYGPPVNGKDIHPYNFATKMQMHGQQIGSHYRGRILFKITGHKDVLNKNSRSKINFKFPFKPTPIVPLKSYTLRFEVLDGFNLPFSQKYNEYYFHYCIGQYMMISNPFNQVKNKSISIMERFLDKKVQFPEDHKQIPDLIIYFAKGKQQRDRISFIRIPAAALLQKITNNQMSIYNLKADLTLNNISKDESGGFITARPYLFSGQPPEAKLSLLSQFGKKKKFFMRIFLYRAKNLPPMNQRGDVDPKLVFHFCGSEKVVFGDSTYNPIWNQIVDLEIQTQDLMSINIEKALICNVYDTEQKQKKKDNLIGNFIVKFSRKNKRKFKKRKSKTGTIQFLYHKPQWYPIINQKVDIGDPCFGHVLMGCALFRQEDKHQIQGDIQKKATNNFIQQITETKKFQLYLLGLRGLEQVYSHLSQKFIRLQIKVGKQNQNKKPVNSKQAEIKLNSANFNQMISFQVPVPKNKSIIPYVDIKVFQVKGDTQTFLGFTSKSLYQLVPKILKTSQNHLGPDQESENQNQQLKQSQISEDTVLDLDLLQRQLDIVRQRKRKKLQALKDLDEKVERQKKKKVQQMVAPKQLTSTNQDTIQKNQQLDKLLKDFQNQYNIKLEQPAYNYASKIQKEKDDETFMRRQSQKMIKIKSQEYIIDMGQQRACEKQNLLKNIPKLQFEKQSQRHKTLRTKTESIGFKQQQPSQIRLQSKVPQKKTIKKPRKSQQQVRIQRMNEINSSKGMQADAKDASSRFGVNPKLLKDDETKTIQNFQLDVVNDIPEVPHDNRAIKYKDLQRIIKQEQKFTKQAMQRQQNYKYAQAVKLSLFKWKNNIKQTERETYLDYDTDPQQNLDIIPQWYKGRKILVTDFEELVPNKKILTLPVYQGGNRIANLDVRQKKTVANLKIIGLSVEQQLRQQKQRNYLKLLKPRSYVCRVYVLKGKSLISNLSRKPTTFLRMSCRGQTYNLRQRTLRQDNYNPQYYICQQIPVQIPGPSTIKIEVVEYFSSLGVTKDKLLGFTQIDLEARHFTKKWHLFTQKKPIQLRNLYSQYGNGTQGRLQVWIDIIQKKNWLSNPPYKIHPPPFDKFQLRVIVWSTKQCVYKNEAFKSNDVYVRGFLGTSQAQETDTHWACRGLGNFNFRFKFEVSYPPKPQDMYSDQFVIQIWDRDVVGYNNLIGQKRINLNKIHRIIQKAVKRKSQVRAKMKIREKGLALTQKFWFDVYNHKVKDQFGQLQSQGKVQLSFQLIPIQKAEKSLKNGFGRSQPNLFPTLQEPAGRLSFNIFHPLDFFKQLFGPQLYNSICYKLICLLVVILLVLIIYLLSGSLMTSAIVSKSVQNTIKNNNNTTN